MSPLRNSDVDFCNCLSALVDAVNGIAIHVSPCWTHKALETFLVKYFYCFLLKFHYVQHGIKSFLQTRPPEKPCELGKRRKRSGYYNFIACSFGCFHQIHFYDRRRFLSLRQAQGFLKFYGWNVFLYLIGCSQFWVACFSEILKEEVQTSKIIDL